MDDGFYCARYLRAWALEVQIRRYFESTFGPLWFETREGGARLRELWSHGQRWTAEGLTRELGYAGLDLNPLFEELMSS